jgi:hypothetical protein
VAACISPKRPSTNFTNAPNSVSFHKSTKRPFATTAKNMNGKQTIHGNGSPVPILLIIGVGLAFVNWLLTDEDRETKPETTPTDAGTENHTVRSVAPTVSATVSQPSVSLRPEISTHPLFPVFVPSTQSDAPTTTRQPPERKRRQIKPEDMATALQHGARAFTLKEAVAALQSLGFGKSAAYEVLSPNGRFSAWLQITPDGKITWKG